MKKKLLIGLLFILAATIGLLLLIRASNDHAECSATVETSKDMVGNTVVTKRHICKERFHL